MDVVVWVKAEVDRLEVVEVLQMVHLFTKLVVSVDMDGHQN